MQELTFMLCHLYVKSTKSVSIPAPVYYSHHAALRGRMYKNAVEPSESQSDSAILNDHSVRSSLIEIHSSLKETMFFT
jgi:eukaryotic translation initiation factor 2C